MSLFWECKCSVAEHRQFWADYVSALSNARKVQSAEKQVLVRAFDKAVRRKPLAFAADAVGLCQLNVAEEGRGRPGTGERVDR